MAIEFREGFEAGFGYETPKMRPYTLGQGELCFMNTMKAISYIPIISTIAWAIILCKLNCRPSQKTTIARAGTARMIICIVGLGFLLPIPDLIATVLLHTNKAHKKVLI